MSAAVQSVHRVKRRNPLAGHKRRCGCFACKYKRGDKNPQELLIFGNPSKDKYGKVFTERGTQYVQFDGGAILLTHAIERSKELGDKAAVKRLQKAKRNPDAVESFQAFHGRDPEEILRPQVSVITRKEYWAVGPLMALGLDDFGWSTKQIVDHWDKLPSVYFTEKDGVKLAAAPPEKGKTKSRQLYVIGGNQDMASQLRNWEGIDPQKDLIDLGDIYFVTYLARKIHDDYLLTTYTHRLGEKTGSLPRLMYDRLRKQLFFAGGEYFIDLNGISPGIEN